MAPAELEELRRRVAARFGSVHAFAKNRPAGLARSTVYQVLSGRYGGNVARQAERIRAALDGPSEGFFEVLRRAACGLCRRKRRRARQCERCYELFRAQEKAIISKGG